MVTCKLINKSGQTELGFWTCRNVPRIGEKLVHRVKEGQWGQVLKVIDVVHYNGETHLHVKYHGGEQHL